MFFPTTKNHAAQHVIVLKVENFMICDYANSHQEQVEVKGRGRGRKQSVLFCPWGVTSDIQKETQLSKLLSATRELSQ